MDSRLHFTASDSREAQDMLVSLRARYGDAGPDKADIIVALGGDGFMLQTLHRFLGRKIPIYGMNFGSVGFLMNPYRADDLPQRLAAAESAEVNPLQMNAISKSGAATALAFNEVSLLRQTRQAAKLRITVDNTVRLEELICDGILVSTPVGSTAYNLSAHGPILPIGAALLALTPLSAFRPRRWRGALLGQKAKIRFDVLEPEKRPVSAVGDDTEVRDVISVEVAEDRSRPVRMLFDAERSLEERIMAEQFYD